MAQTTPVRIERWMVSGLAVGLCSQGEKETENQIYQRERRSVRPELSDRQLFGSRKLSICRGEKLALQIPEPFNRHEPIPNRVRKSQ